jgi:hypothetical protein
MECHEQLIDALAAEYNLLSHVYWEMCATNSLLPSRERRVPMSPIDSASPAQSACDQRPGCRLFCRSTNIVDFPVYSVLLSKMSICSRPEPSRSLSACSRPRSQFLSGICLRLRSGTHKSQSHASPRRMARSIRDRDNTFTSDDTVFRHNHALHFREVPLLTVAILFPFVHLPNQQCDEERQLWANGQGISGLTGTSRQAIATRSSPPRRPDFSPATHEHDPIVNDF